MIFYFSVLLPLMFESVPMFSLWTIICNKVPALVIKEKGKTTKVFLQKKYVGFIQAVNLSLFFYICSTNFVNYFLFYFFKAYGFVVLKSVYSIDLVLSSICVVFFFPLLSFMLSITLSSISYLFTAKLDLGWYSL